MAEITLTKKQLEKIMKDVDKKGRVKLMKLVKFPFSSFSFGRLGPVLLSAVFLIFVGCAHIPEYPHKPVSYSHAPAEEGLLVEASKSVLRKAEEGESAFMLILNNEDALRWRLALIDSAQQSIDLKTFIWSDDESGRLVLDRLSAAAERGIQIRLLLDDMPKDWSDEVTALVARIPNIQLRRFNPGRVRKGLIRRMLQMSIHFRELNRRMHNKQMVVDGQWGIIGGRNIGNPYFGLARKYNNRDLDLLITGAILPKMAADFDEYWNADAAYPGEAMSDKLSDKKIRKIQNGFDLTVMEDRKLFAQTRIPPYPIDWSGEFARLPDQMVMGVAQLMQDSPEVKGDRGVRLLDQINEVAIEIKYQSCLITPYMIPTKKQIADMALCIEEDGQRVRLLVPAMESNNHTMVHSHYKKYRKRILKAGAELYEFRAQPSMELRAVSDTSPVVSNFISLHTKAFVIDDRWVLVGSLNYDPRSIQINTEHMLLINSPELATQLLSDFEIMTAPENAWAVTLNDKGELRWTSSDGVRKHQPARGFVQRCSDFFWRWMPVESQL